MSPANSYTDWHVDFGGSSVGYHLISGKKKKVFAMASPPTEKKNLQSFKARAAPTESSWAAGGRWVRGGTRGRGGGGGGDPRTLSRHTEHSLAVEAPPGEPGGEGEGGGAPPAGRERPRGPDHRRAEEAARRVEAGPHTVVTPVTTTVPWDAAAKALRYDVERFPGRAAVTAAAPGPWPCPAS